MALENWQKTELEAPLSKEHVSTREGAGGKELSYIESHHAIREANRIFGFDGWHSDTLHLKLVAQYEEEDKFKKTKQVVVYEAKVRVEALGVIRDGIGHGISAQYKLADAHEMAAKTAESDARKRALMTFGNPFGLALYDKEQKEVDNSPKSSYRARKDGDWKQYVDEIEAIKDVGKVREWLAENAHKVPAGWAGSLREFVEVHISELTLNRMIDQINTQDSKQAIKDLVALPAWGDQKDLLVPHHVDRLKAASEARWKNVE